MFAVTTSKQTGGPQTRRLEDGEHSAARRHAILLGEVTQPPTVCWAGRSIWHGRQDPDPGPGGNAPTPVRALSAWRLRPRAPLRLALRALARAPGRHAELPKREVRNSGGRADGGVPRFGDAGVRLTAGAGPRSRELRRFVACPPHARTNRKLASPSHRAPPYRPTPPSLIRSAPSTTALLLKCTQHAQVSTCPAVVLLVLT